jgi:hypothetical protein
LAKASIIRVPRCFSTRGEAPCCSSTLQRRGGLLRHSQAPRAQTWVGAQDSGINMTRVWCSVCDERHDATTTCAKWVGPTHRRTCCAVSAGSLAARSRG